MSKKSGTHPVTRYRVLVVDDDAPARDTLEAVLSAEVEVVSCGSPGRALELFVKRPFHVVCSDYDMPEMNGVQLLRRVSALSEHVGCLLVTGGQEYLRAGHNAEYYVLLKPFDPGRLLDLVLQLGRIAEMKRTVRSLRGRQA